MIINLFLFSSNLQKKLNYMADEMLEEAEVTTLNTVQVRQQRA